MPRPVPSGQQWPTVAPRSPDPTVATVVNWSISNEHLQDARGRLADLGMIRVNISGFKMWKK